MSFSFAPERKILQKTFSNPCFSVVLHIEIMCIFKLFLMA